MQDWLDDDPMDNLRAWKTATLLYAEDFSACATCEQKPWISFFFDGTGNNRKIDEPLEKLSNIARLHEAHREERPLIRKHYYPGVGTRLDASDPRWVDKIRDSEMLGGAMGLGWDARLEKAEDDLRFTLTSNHKVKRIDVAVFGFSRGATLARAFVNRLLAKCTFKDNVPHWPCPTAIDGESAPLHFRFLGLFDTVESVGLPAHNLSSMRTDIPEQVDRCLHFVAAHELRACFPLTPVRNSAGLHEEIVFPGVHSDVGGGYRPNEQARSDALARITLNKMRRQAAISGVPFTPPSMAGKNVNDLFEYDADLKSLLDEYKMTVGMGSALEEQVFQHMRLYYGWLKVRFGNDPWEVYRTVSCVNPEVDAQLLRIKDLHHRMSRDADTMNWRAWVTYLWNTDRNEYKRTIETAGGASPMTAPLTDEQLAYWDAWLNPPTLSPNLIRFFDKYVHDSRAGFIDVDSSGYLRPRRIMDVPWNNTPSGDAIAAKAAIFDAARSPRAAFSPGA